MFSEGNLKMEPRPNGGQSYETNFSSSQVIQDDLKMLSDGQQKSETATLPILLIDTRDEDEFNREHIVTGI